MPQFGEETSFHISREESLIHVEAVQPNKMDGGTIIVVVQHDEIVAK